MTINSAIISLVALVGLIVLIAMGKLTADVGLPVITAIAGVHVGAGISNNSNTQ